MTYRYDQARELIHKRIAEYEGLLAALDLLERSGASPDALIHALTSSGVVKRHKPAKPAPNGHGGPREVANPGGETWREAIDAVLADVGEKKLLVSEIVEELQRRGRRFGPKARPDTIVRSTLNRCYTEMGWGYTRKKPHRWFKRGGAENTGG